MAVSFYCSGGEIGLFTSDFSIALNRLKDIQGNRAIFRARHSDVTKGIGQMKSESNLPRKLQLRVFCSGFGSWLTTNKAKRFRGSRHSAALALWLAVSIPLLSGTFALDPSLSLGQYRLVRWDQDQGLPQNVAAPTDPGRTDPLGTRVT